MARLIFTSLDGDPGAEREQRRFDREVEMIRLLADGHSQGEIALRFGLEPDSIRGIFRRCVDRWGARSRVHLVAMLLRLGLIE